MFHLHIPNRDLLLTIFNSRHFCWSKLFRSSRLPQIPKVPQSKVKTLPNVTLVLPKKPLGVHTIAYEHFSFILLKLENIICIHVYVTKWQFFLFQTTIWTYCHIVNFVYTQTTPSKIYKTHLNFV